MARVIRTLGVTLYPSAHCNHCGWDYSESPNARDAAKDHAKYRPGHVAIVQTVKRDSYQLEGT